MPQQDTFPSKIFDIIQEIANLSVEGNYIFRGEPEYHCKISSTLYRECERMVQEAGLESELSDFDIKAIEEEIFNQVNKFIPRGEYASDLSIFTQLQHYASQTNLIDFTTDCHIALFFACDGQPGKNGRVILQERNLVPVEEPLGVEHRVLAQKSVFVRPKQGYIDQNESKYKVVDVPACLKEDMLRYLKNTHGITTETIYNDIHGYIRNREIHRAAYREFYIAFAYQSKAEKMEDPEEKHELWDEAIKHYSKAIDYNPNLHPAYAKRSTLYENKEEYDKAMQDRLKAWGIFPDVVLEPDRDSTGSWMPIQEPISEVEVSRVSTKAHEDILELLQERPLIVKMPNGQIITNSQGIDTFLEVIQMLGIEKVKALGIIAVQGRNLPLISDYEDPTHSQKPLGSYYIASGNSTRQKKEWLEEIARHLNIEMTVIANPKTRG